MDLVYITATVAYTSFSLWLLYWFVSTLRTTRKDAAAAIVILSRIDIGLSAVLSDLEGVHARLDNLSASHKAGVSAAKKVAAE